MKNVTLLTLGLGLLIVVVLLLGCACHDVIDHNIGPKAKVEKPTAVFEGIPDSAWLSLKEELALNGIKVNGPTGTIYYGGVSVKYDYLPKCNPLDPIMGSLIIHKVRVGIPASLFSWKEKDVLDLLKEKLVKYGVKL